ncbi:MAG: hypothetical protein ACT4PL_10150, partial [Phycisphaerales bacterium]
GVDLFARFDIAWRPLLVSMVLAAALGALNEGLTGRTLGKRLTGCGVLTVQRVTRRSSTDAATDAQEGEPDPAASADEPAAFAANIPTMRSAVVRNIVKWLFPPLFLLAFLDPMLRSPADALGRTVVVQRARSDDDEQD